MYIRPFLLPALVLLILAVDNLRANEGDSLAPRVGVIGIAQTEKIGTTGRCNAVVVFDKGLPVACFGVRKLPQDKGRYLYFLLFKNAPGKFSGSQVAGKANREESVEQVSVDDTVQLHLGKKVIDIACKFTVDQMTLAVTSETIRIGKTEIKKDGARVFLVDLSQDKVTYLPVKVALPDAVPDLKDKKSWPKTILQAVEHLRKKSLAVKKFLE